MEIKKPKYFYPEKPKLIHPEQDLVDKLSDSNHWVAEPKYNGSRLVLHLIDGRPEFWDRHGKKLTYQPTEEVLEALKVLPQKGYYQFDGELRDSKTKGIRHQIVLWDVFIHHGKLLTGMPYWARRQLLSVLVPETDDSKTLSRITQYTDNFREVFESVKEDDEIEGLVLKNMLGKLNLGRTSGPASSWMYKMRKPTKNYRF